MAILTHSKASSTSRATQSCTIQRRSGNFCDEAAWPDAPFPICRHHAVKLYIEMRGIHAAALNDEWLSLPPINPRAVVNAENAKLDEELHKARQAERSVVYYVRIGEVIKIGFTSNLKQRMSALRTSRDNVLATEPGGKDLESKRHKQFKSIRIGLREDFTPTLALIRHIEAVRDFHGDPVFS